MSNFDDDDGKQYGDYQDDERQGDGIIRIQWRQGDIKQNTPGYFFLDKAAVPEGFAPAGKIWAPVKEFFESTNSRKDGWKAEALPVAIICAKAQPYRRPPSGSDLPKKWLETWPKGEDNIAMHCDVLLIAQGLEDLGVVCLSTGATTTAFALVADADPRTDPQGGILYRIRKEVLAAADKAAKIAYREKKKLYWLFWVTIASQRDAKGEVVFTPTKAKAVTKPVLILPAVVDTQWLTTNFVGGEWAQYGEEMRSLYDDWRMAKRTNDDAPAKPANGRNIPQPIEEEAPTF